LWRSIHKPQEKHTQTLTIVYNPTDIIFLVSGMQFPIANYTSATAELGSKIHRQFRNAHEGHRPHAGLDPSRASTGVVWTTERAYEHGFLEHPEQWANLGQGAPEVDDDIEGCFERPHHIDVSMTGREYVTHSISIVSGVELTVFYRAPLLVSSP